MAALFGFIALSAAPVLPVAGADTVQTLDLSRSVGFSPIVSVDAVWLLPHGRQVIDGVPFQIDGSFLLRGYNNTQTRTPGWASVTNIFVDCNFERLHLLAGSDTSGPDGIAVAKVRLLYTDGSDAALELKYGQELRGWQALRHKAEPPLQGTNSRVVWTGQNSTAAASDKFVRLFHVTLANPSPEKKVAKLAFESARTQYGLIVVAASVGPALAERMPDTVAIANKNPFPDERPRTGEPARGEGYVKSMDGKPLAGAAVRVMAVREFGKRDRDSATDSPEAGTLAMTDADGHFILPPLPDNRLYRLLAVADGFDSAQFLGMDPKSDPVEIRLKPLGANDGKPLYSVKARVVGPDGKPLAFAVVEPDGVGMGGGTSWGGSQGFASQAVTGTNGEFTLGRATPFDRIQLTITSKGLAPNKLWLNVTNEVQAIKMGVGAIIRGRVLLEDKPLAGVKVAVSGQDRNSEVYAGRFQATTGTNGDFIFEHLPPDTAWEFYGTMDSFKKYGALPPRMEQTSGHGQVTDLGDLKLVPALHLAGLVKTRQGEPLPPGLKVIVEYGNGMDSQTADVDGEGRFRFEGLGKAMVQIYVNENGWRLTAANRGMDMWNPWWLTGTLEADKDDLWLMIEKGDRQYNYGGMSNGQLPPQDQPGSRPISGVEPSGPEPVTLAGKVVDDDTGKPVNVFEVQPGYKPPSTGTTMAQPPLIDRLLNPRARPAVPWNEQIYWLRGHNESFSNGVFSVDFVRLSSAPVLQIEAPGYEPFQSDPTNVTVTNLVFRLKKGNGPNGVVLLPNGQPAAGATVVYGAAREQFTLSGTSLAAYGQTNCFMVTPSDGKFSFPARPEGVTLFVAHSAGWAMKNLSKTGVDKLTVELEPWCTVTGTLVDSNNVPVPNVKMALTMFRDWNRGGALANTQFNVTTDANGNFTFNTVPPGRLELQKMVPMTFPGSSGGMTYQMQAYIVARPGIKNDLGKVVMDQGVKESAFDAIKDRLGF